MKIQNLIGIYVFTFASVSALGLNFPSVIAPILDIFSPVKFDFYMSNYVMYRMSLFLSGTMVYLFFVPIIWRKGFDSAEEWRIKKLNWLLVFFLIFLLPLMWIGYPFLALCTNCLTGNDFFYFCLTLSLFIGLQGFTQVILLKLFSFLRGR